MIDRKAPIVAIIGRANVGKSSLFNAILGRREAIVADEPGTTRDSVTAKVHWGGKGFWLVDSAGFKDARDEFELTIQDQIAQAATSADVIVVVIEAQIQITEEDRRAAKLALNSRKKVVLVVNKADKNKAAQPNDFRGLGVWPIIMTAATQRVGIEQLLNELTLSLPLVRVREADDRLRVALLGRPNVGKSALFNALAHKQQAIVSERAGTTRDVNRLIIRYEKREIELLDTAGIRRSGKIEPGVEKFSVLRSLAAIEEADVSLLLMDAGELNVGLDQKIAGLVKEAGKGLILVVSKWDTVEKDRASTEQRSAQIAANFAFVPWAPLIFTSSLSGQNVTKIFELVLDIAGARARKVKTTELNRWLRVSVNIHPPAGLKNHQPKLRYMVQEEDNPIPSFKIFGAYTRFLHWSYKRYLERSFRQEWPYVGTPVKFWFIDKPVGEKLK